MRHRVGFAVSLLAACGIHAAILLVPRAAIPQEVPIPTVELDLTAAPAFAEVTPAVTRRITPVVAAITRPIAAREAALSATPPDVPLAASAPDQPGSALPESPAPPVTADSGEAQGGIAGGSPDASADVAASPSSGGTGTTSFSAPAPAAAPVSALQLLPPRPRAEILPSYPRSARRSGLEGVVKVSAMVDASGSVRSVEVLVSSGHAPLDQAALEAVRRTLFMPALQEGKAVPCRVVIPIRFQLSGTAQ